MRDLFDIHEHEVLRRVRQIRRGQRAILVSGLTWAAAKRLSDRGMVGIRPHAPMWGEEAGYAFPRSAKAEDERDRDQRLVDEHEQLADGGEGYVELLAHGGAR